nr:DUF2715 domain-containing protein [uncultured Treponema sp.]
MKKYLCILFLLSVCAIGSVFAKVSLTLDVGPIYTHFSHRSDTTSAGRTHTWATHTGGLNVLLRAEFAKNFGVYGMANFAFGNRMVTGFNTKTHCERDKWDASLSYAIDSQFGFFYAFKPKTNLEIMLGAGIGIGGSGYNYSSDRYHYTNIGGGINCDVSYMFTKLIGIYGGLSDTLYAPVSVSHTVKSGSDSTTTTSSSAGKIANAFSLKAGIQFKF